MPSPSVTYTFSNSTTADATQVNTNFTDLINGMSDGTKDFSISALTCAGALTANGNVNLGNASGDDLTISASLASTLSIKTNATYNIGSATLGLLSVYLGTSTFTTRILGAATASWTLTLPATAGSDKDIPVNTGAGTLSWVNRTIRTTAAKTTTYTATSTDEVLLCDTSGGAWTLTLPAAASNTGKVYVIKKTTSDTNALTIDGNSSETIDGTTTKLLFAQYESVTIICDGSNWHVI